MATPPRLLEYICGKGDQILIGDQITVQIRKIQAGQVSLGISAPKSIPILRAEIVDKYPPDPPQSGQA